MEKAIWLDMDGSFVDLYGVENWLEDLISKNPRPYYIAKPLLDLNQLTQALNRLKELGYTINIVSWLAKNSNPDYDKLVTLAKLFWLETYLPLVKFDKIKILPYGTPKSKVGTGFLFDDEERNRDEWKGIAYNEKDILNVLNHLH